MDILSQTTEYLLEGVIGRRGVGELDKDTAVLDMGLYGLYLEAVGVDVGE